MSQKEKEERILWKKNEVADYEATTLSIFYNNTLLLDLVIVVSFFILKNFNPTVSYILSISASSGLIVLLAPKTSVTGKKNLKKLPQMHSKCKLKRQNWEIQER
uniref:Translocon-associated protein subunit gamma n=1 Tax=Castor canadensis TaxID=51338 RepID=A0A8C0XGM1_CASCN